MNQNTGIIRYCISKKRNSKNQKLYDWLFFRTLYEEITFLLKNVRITTESNDFLKKKSQEIYSKINQLQFGNNCATSKKLVCEVEQNCGLNFFFFSILFKFNFEI